MASILDSEIERLQAKGMAPITASSSVSFAHARPANSLRRALQIQVSTVLLGPSTNALLAPATPDLTSVPALLTPSQENTRAALSEHVKRHAAHNTQSLYRACAGITTFRMRDPDPKAVDGGNVLGVRIDVVTRARFAKPYYLLLNRPWDGQKQYWRLHRHTVPPAVPVEAIAARCLPAPPKKSQAAIGDVDDGQIVRHVKKQDLIKFVRTLRRDMVRYHNRIAGVADLRHAAGLDITGRKPKSRSGAGGGSIADISPADSAAKQIKIDWADGKSGRLVLDEDGHVTKFVILNEQGRSRGTTRRLLARGLKLDDVVSMLAEDVQGS
jgi:central kinetochore subunit Mal2/MCM21